MPRSLRQLIAIGLLPLGAVGIALWGAGAAIRRLGIITWMFCHRICRDPGCSCGECREFG